MESNLEWTGGYRQLEVLYVVAIQATGSLISFHSLLANVCGMLAMFLWKHELDLMRNKDRCIYISSRDLIQTVSALANSKKPHRISGFCHFCDSNMIQSEKEAEECE